MEERELNEHLEAVKESKTANKKSKDSLWELLYNINSTNN